MRNYEETDQFDIYRTAGQWVVVQKGTLLAVAIDEWPNDTVEKVIERSLEDVPLLPGDPPEKPQYPAHGVRMFAQLQMEVAQVAMAYACLPTYPTETQARQISAVQHWLANAYNFLADPKYYMVHSGFDGTVEELVCEFSLRARQCMEDAKPFGRARMMDVNVTQQHIDEGVAWDCKKCAVALAIGEVLPVGTEFSVDDRRTLTIGENMYRLPDVVAEFIEKLDIFFGDKQDGVDEGNKLPEPICFVIDLGNPVYCP